MNNYKKFYTNVFVAECEEMHKKGDVISVTTKYGKENKHIVHNLVGKSGTEEDPRYLYSITRVDGTDSRDRAKRIAGKLNKWAASAEIRSSEWMEKSLEGKDFLALGEPIKVGHHSEKRHRALIDRNHSRMGKSIEESKKAASYRSRAEYWERMSEEINISMPESLEFFEVQLEEAKQYHKFLKDNPSERSFSMALSYAKKKVNTLAKKLEVAKNLWG